MTQRHQTSVDRLYSEFDQTIGVLDAAGEITLRNAIGPLFQKSLLLSAASYFEVRVTGAVSELISEATNNDTLVTEFARKKAISRQYHTYFSWDAKNANAFFGLFGTEFRAYMSDRLKDDDETQDAISAFMDIGRERNRIAHEDFGDAHLNETLNDVNDVYKLYERALLFVDRLPTLFADFRQSRNVPSP